ncbi:MULTISPECIES: hypothetical protein [Enterococcus]|uniref:hypothetical protein n=1 Tax=Enterococcus TaxID=1350 RepID=UPI0032E4F4FC
MRLNGELAYEKLGNDLYLSLNDEIYLLDNEVSIYIPFCEHICYYCDFYRN